MTKEEFVKGAVELYDSKIYFDRKKNAKKELEECREKGIDVTNLQFIVEEYPDFDSINFKCTADAYVFSIAIDARIASREYVASLAAVFFDECQRINGGKEPK